MLVKSGIIKQTSMLRFLEGRRSLEARMNTVTLSVASRDDESCRALSDPRPQAVGAAAGDDRPGRDVDPQGGATGWSRHQDRAWRVQVLIKARMVDRTKGGVIFPHDAVHVDFKLTRRA